MRKEIDNYKIEINIINLIILLFLFRTAIPQFKYPFLVLYFGSLIYFIIKYKDRLIKHLIKFIRTFSVVLLLVSILLLSFLLSNKLYLIIFKDLTNIAILLSLIFLLKLVIITREELNFYIQNLIKLIISFALLISIFSITNIFSSRPGYELFTFSKITDNSDNQLPYLDYNFALLPVFLGMVGILKLLYKSKSFSIKIIYSLILVIYSTNILLAGSKRGIIVLTGLFLITLFAIIINSYKKVNSCNEKNLNFSWFLLPLVVLTTLFYIFIFHTPYSFKIKTFDLINTKNVFLTKDRITRSIFNYQLILNKNVNYFETYNTIWTSTFNPKDPDSGWGTRNHKTIFTLTGNNVKIVPNDAKGYYMDKTSNSDTWNNNAYSYTLVATDSLTDGELYSASVFCYVSSEFNGEWARISAEGEVQGRTNDSYEMTRKGSWQRLVLTGISEGGKLNIYLYFSKYDDKDFSNLLGHVIFAYPQYRKVEFDSNDPDTWGTRKHKTIYPLSGDNVEIVPTDAMGYMLDSTSNASTWDNNAFSYTLIGNDSVSDGEIVNASAYCYVSEDFDGTWVCVASEGSTFGRQVDYYDLEKKGTWQKLTLTAVCKTGIAPTYLYFSKFKATDFSSLKGHVIFAYPQYRVIKKESLQSYFDSNKLINQNLIKTLFDSSQINSYERIANNNSTQNINDYSSAKNIDYIQSSMLFFSLPKFSLIEDSIQFDIDPIRNFVAKLISEDTTYFPYKENIVVDSVLGKFLAPRTVRWQFAWQIYTKEYNIRQKILGGGFAHLNWFGYYFSNDKTKSDYPHNPFLSILLYSGAFGLILYLYLMYKVIAIYIKYIKEYYMLFIFFCITFFFSFFSAGSPFDPPVMGFFVMLPFLMDTILKKDKSD